jgi:tRNA 2-selenouridine synthase
MTRTDSDDYRALLLAATPLLDVRAPVEFAAGSIPGAQNVPILDNDERAAVGTAYKHEGQQAAITLGHRLVSGARKAARIARWQAFAAQHPDGYLYCFRGGLRSQTAQAWLREAGIELPLVRGGYKAMRQFLMQELATQVQAHRYAIVAGRTGSGKTRVIGALHRAIDLEGLANHRGSSFGRLPDGQPTQVDFENRLAVDLMRTPDAGRRALWLEDESRLIGRCALPQELRARMESAPRAIVEEPFDSRAQVVLEDYVLNALPLYEAMHGEDGFALYADNLLSGVDRIQKRLGGLMHRKVREAMSAALDAQRAGRGSEAHRDWIALLLTHYYDPMYDFQLAQKQGEVLFSGTRAEVTEYINSCND